MSDNNTRRQIANNLKKARLKRGLTQSELADKSGISTNYYARVERAEVSPSLDIFERLIKALKVTSSEIL